MRDIQLKRIMVKGSVEIGQELELVQAAERPSATDEFSDVGRPAAMPAVDYAPHLARSGELSMQRLVYSLANSDTKLSIEDDGLCASYGIFGAPGSGKTHLLLYLLRQILDVQKDDPERKFGGLILDPKAALMDEVRTIVDLAGRILSRRRQVMGDQISTLKDCLRLCDGILPPSQTAASRDTELKSCDSCIPAFCIRLLSNHTSRVNF